MKAEKIAKSEVYVNTLQFEFSHGRKPSGGCEYTPWLFQIVSEQKSFNGKYSDAKRQAVSYAASNGEYEVIVLP